MVLPRIKRVIRARSSSNKGLCIDAVHILSPQAPRAGALLYQGAIDRTSAWNSNFLALSLIFR